MPTTAPASPSSPGSNSSEPAPAANPCASIQALTVADWDVRQAASCVRSSTCSARAVVEASV